jgi:LacI family transcriptional regulator
MALRPIATVRRRIALVIETSNQYGRGLLQGVGRFVREHAAWSVTLMEGGRGDGGAAHLAGWSGDGILARVENPRIAAAVARAGVPAVDLSAARLLPGLPWVETDDRAIAELALQHLRERGFTRFAFLADRRFAWSTQRSRHFTALLTAADLPCTSHAVATTQPVAQARAATAAWLQAQQFPLAVFCAYDPLGHHLLEVARSLGIQVPEQLAVLGVDDDAVLCSLGDPPLSSIRPDAEGAGYAAATLLERALSGQTLRPQGHFLQPLGVAERASTDGVAVADPKLRAALALAQARACDGIGIPAMVRAAGLSRQVLDRRCQRVLGRSLKAELDRIRLRRVGELLRATDLPVAEIARRTGFAHPEYLGVCWRRHTGVSPAAWRKLAH